MGFPSDEAVEQVRLKGPLNRTQFWRQAGVLEEFQRTLQGKLVTAPFAPLPQQRAPQSPVSSSELDHSTTVQRRGLLKKRQDFSPRMASTSTIERATTEAAVEQTSSGLLARVVLEDLCFRTVSEFGLYETISRPAVVIYVVAGL